MSERPRTIRVLVHLDRHQRAAVSVLKSVWRGPVRLDMRLASARPVDPVAPAPRGVDPDLWLAYAALSDRVWTIAREHDSGVI